MDTLVVFDAARGDHFLQVRIGRLRGEGGAGAEEDWDEAAEVVVVNNCMVQRTVPRIVSRVDRGQRCE